MKDIRFFPGQIIIGQFAFLTDSPPESDSVRLNTQISFKIEKENKKIGCRTLFRFEGSIPFMVLDTMCVFTINVEDWNSFIDSKACAIVIPCKFLHQLAMQAVGTARGILFCKTENTLFSRFILPNINVEEVILDNVLCKI